MSFHLHVSSSLAAVGGPFNSPVNFSIQLPKALYLEGEWVVGLVDSYIQIPKDISIKHNVVYLCGDFIEHTILGDKLMPFVKALYLKDFENYFYFTNIQYIPLNSKNIQQLGLNLLSENNKQLQQTALKKACFTFHFKRVK